MHCSVHAVNNCSSMLTISTTVNQQILAQCGQARNHSRCFGCQKSNPISAKSFVVGTLVSSHSQVGLLSGFLDGHRVCTIFLGRLSKPTGSSQMWTMIDGCVSLPSCSSYDSPEPLSQPLYDKFKIYFNEIGQSYLATSCLTGHSQLVGISSKLHLLIEESGVESI